MGGLQLQQTPLFSNILASGATLAGIKNAFSGGILSTGRVYWRCPGSTVSNTTASTRHGRETPDSVSSVSLHESISSGNVELCWMRLLRWSEVTTRLACGWL